jgi:uncharacterized membrane protein
LVLFLALGAGYWRFVWSRAAPTIAWVWGGVSYQLLDPRMLGVVLLAPWFVAILAFTLADLPWLQRFMSVVLRITFVAALAIGLARPVRTSDSDKICTVYLVDVSQSVPDEALADAQQIVADGYDKRRPDDLVRVVTFAARPRLVEGGAAEGDKVAAPTIERHPSEMAAASNLQAALQLAYGLYPPGYLRRAVLVSDGLETDGDVLAEANRANEYGVRLHTIPYRREVPGEVAVRSLGLPSRVKVGETFEVKADVYASRATRAKARLYQGETLNGLDGVKELELKPGKNEVVFQSVVRVPGEVTYALRLSDIRVDRFKENNGFSTTIDVPGRPQVLYVEGTPEHAQPLSRALSAQQFDVDVRAPAGFPTSLKEIERYDFVILSDTPREAVSLGAQEIVEQYVRDLGGGFLYAGGDNGYGLGGWYRTTIARILPVHMETEQRKEMPSVALMLVIDRSGSMTGLPMEMAKKAAAATLEVLAPDDIIGVVAFDSQPHRYVKLQPARNRSRIRGLISRIQPGGGTEIFAALDAAYNDLTVTPARKKHVILLTDGKAPPSGIRDLVTAMVAESITVTTVGLGTDLDEQLLRMISDVGGGRFNAVTDAQSLPRIFTNETEMVARAAASEEWFPVAQTGAASFLRQLDVRTAPHLHGYVSTKLKASPAVELLANADTDEPILARWRVGLGWSLAWTSDVKARWAVEWVGWPGWEKFWGQLVHEHMRQKDRRELDMHTELVDGVLHATVDAFTIDERFDTGLDSKLTVAGPDPTTKTTTAMRQTAPGRYEARVPLEGYGSFLLKAEHAREQDDGSMKSVAISVGHVANPYPREFSEFKADRVTLERAALATGGRFDPEDRSIALSPEGQTIRFNEDLWSRLVMLALGLFLLDLLLRRVRLFNRKFRPARRSRALSYQLSAVSSDPERR